MSILWLCLVINAQGRLENSGGWLLGCCGLVSVCGDCGLVAYANTKQYLVCTECDAAVPSLSQHDGGRVLDVDLGLRARLAALEGLDETDAMLLIAVVTPHADVQLDLGVPDGDDKIPSQCGRSELHFPLCPDEYDGEICVSLPHAVHTVNTVSRHHVRTRIMCTFM